MSERRYGVRWMPTWPHINLGVSAHLSRKFGHVSLHLPFGLLVVGHIGLDHPMTPTGSQLEEENPDDA